ALSRTPDEAVRGHIAECPECAAQFELMRDHSAALKSLRAPADVEPRPGFYARVMERIEAEGASIWDLFFESAFGKRIAAASLALAVLAGVYLFTTVRSDQQELSATPAVVESVPADFGMDVPVIPMVQSVGMSDTAGFPDKDSVLVNLVTYREQ